MKKRKRLRIAIQKKGRLNSDSMDLLYRCGLKIHSSKSALYCHAENHPLDVLYVRVDDIPPLIMDGICDIGIVGENVLLEQDLYQKNNGNEKFFSTERKLGFSNCRLSIAVPQDKEINHIEDLSGIRIATSYPNLLSEYLTKNNIKAKILNLTGSVEIAPRLDMADAICDLVSTGRTLEENNLVEFDSVINSQAVLIKSSKTLDDKKLQMYDLLLRRIDGVLQAQDSKYIMFHAPKNALTHIKNLLPGFESPTIIPLNSTDEKVAVHVVSPEGAFWITLEKLKELGASSILVLPIEKMLS